MAMVYRYIGILTVNVLFFRSPGIFHSQDSFPLTFHPRLWETSSGMIAVGVFIMPAVKALVLATDVEIFSNTFLQKSISHMGLSRRKCPVFQNTKLRIFIIIWIIIEI